MRQYLRASATAFALLATISLSSALRAQGGNQPLSQQQQQSVSKGLANQPTDSAPTGYQGQVGAKVPDSMTAHPMPNNVASDVPATKNLLFVKLPDRVLLIDPDSNAIAEILLVSDTTGSTSGQQK
jgi:hypothetical protein